MLSTHPRNQIDTTQSHGDGKELGTLSLALAVHIKNPNSSSVHFPDLGSHACLTEAGEQGILSVTTPFYDTEG